MVVPQFLVSVLCRVLVIKRGEVPLHVSLLPSGTCSYCCPINLDRDIDYLLYTRRNPTYPTRLDISNPYSLRNSNFDNRYPTVIFIHGYSDSASGGSSITTRDVYLKRGQHNVILVDWAKLAGLPWYVTAVRNTKIVGPQVARFVKWLDAQGAVPFSKLHVIGFSLGAEIAGFMGKALAPRKVGRITGLDPAYPLYKNTGREGHLTAADATFVDVIHTDGGNFGFPNPLGHVDFYPNGGKPIQPGCTLGNVIRRSVSRIINQYIVCGHNRAWMLYAESVTNPSGFPASRCPRWRPDIRANCIWTPEVLMGYAVPSTVRGKFYLRTNGNPPYARNMTGYIGK
ncbi:pancreatic lipase-related protein 2-like isoform X1 [Hylaeus anthracinus]|uniref:pancreatic lipase-related protein 2-like isoform X1 n=1 Tax=Hylaeus anthracinus TaxID=313031 RepID=UPI0023BA3464|nr:pancreatic lipase-related protein 2-like isoform X1 [Hylaeus anthracinus]XP_053996742.1 pancreatic lipase-related protein 2-like isoform X1 [Hylaeus anthracinus]